MPASDDLPRLRRVLAPNPSALTDQGTNSYILGSGRVAVIDPGPDHDRHLAALLAALDAGETVSHIFVTHPHRDHSALAARLGQATGAPVLAFGTAAEGRSPAMQAWAAAGLSEGGGLDHDFRPDARLVDGQTITGADWSLVVHHTPGHLGTHVCLAAGTALFSGDHVMGWSSSVIAPPDGDMGEYLAALERLAAVDWTRFLPGHGGTVEDPQGRLRDLIAHRRTRAEQILAALAEGAQDAATLARRIYPGLTPALMPAARGNVLAHLIDLAGQGRVAAPTTPHPDGRFSRH